jgi:hypothetical protein
MENKNKENNPFQDYDHPTAWKISGRLQTLTLNYFVFKRNYLELIKIIEIQDDPKKFLNLIGVKDRLNADVVEFEIARLLHNFLASAKTLVDHTRILIFHWYKEDNFIIEYKTHVSEIFENNHLSGFIEDLRNFNLHYSMPIIHFRLTGHEDKSFEFSFFLSKSELLQWSGWTHKGKPFLAIAKKEIPIEQFVNDYERLISDFHIWLYTRLEEIHSKELTWLSEMQKINK